MDCPGHPIPEQSCHRCGQRVDRASSLDGELPRPGDVNVCLRCMAVTQYGPGLIMFPLSDAELAALSPQERMGIRQVQRAIRAMRQARAAGQKPPSPPAVRRRGDPAATLVIPARRRN